jgi:hypothetical protein
MPPDLDAEVERVRRMSPAEKFHEVCRLTDIERQRIMDEIRAMHPHTSELELRCMYAYEWLGEELARKFWPHDVRGVEEGRVSLSSVFPNVARPLE